MLAIQIDCACGHYNTITDERIITRFQRAEKMTYRCNGCGKTDRTEARLAWQAVVNALADSKEDG
ncbi:hypothetical protein [Leisingera sp. ANG-M7]|uniref:hypothetical protein n=1 Tax=Leisingera sp. ANG-M7 TaxID=1577902 RepID=UPI00057FC640|nr:hypothetical protein [Leisingera sp. ANG-M7]KIC39342.1 hypothetical protein RA26_01425 [Leisingera sp. ANG-M7]